MQRQQPGSSHWLPSDAEEGIVGRALAVNMPGAAHRQDTGRTKGREDKKKKKERQSW